MKYFTALWKLQCFCEIAEEPKDDYVKYYGNNRYDIMVITHFSIFNYWDYIKIFRQKGISLPDVTIQLSHWACDPQSLSIFTTHQNIQNEVHNAKCVIFCLTAFILPTNPNQTVHMNKKGALNSLFKVATVSGSLWRWLILTHFSQNSGRKKGSACFHIWMETGLPRQLSW